MDFDIQKRKRKRIELVVNKIKEAKTTKTMKKAQFTISHQLPLETVVAILRLFSRAELCRLEETSKFLYNVITKFLPVFPHQLLHQIDFCQNEVFINAPVKLRTKIRHTLGLEFHGNDHDHFRNGYFPWSPALVGMLSASSYLRFKDTTVQFNKTTMDMDTSEFQSHHYFVGSAQQLREIFHLWQGMRLIFDMEKCCPPLGIIEEFGQCSGRLHCSFASMPPIFGFPEIKCNSLSLFGPLGKYSLEQLVLWLHSNGDQSLKESAKQQMINDNNVQYQEAKRLEIINLRMVDLPVIQEFIGLLKKELFNGSQHCKYHIMLFNDCDDGDRRMVDSMLLHYYFTVTNIRNREILYFEKEDCYHIIERKLIN